MKKILFFAFLSLILISASYAQEELLLADAIQKGLENNFQIRIYSQTSEISKNNNSWGVAGRFPSIDLGIRQNNRFDNTPSQANPDDRSKYYTNFVHPYISLQWILFRGFAVQITKQKLEALENLSEGNTAIIVENTIQSIVLAYYKVLLEQEKLKVLEKVKNLSRDRYDYMIERKNLGSAVTFDVLQAKNAFLSDSSNFLLQKLNLKNANLNLHLLLGKESKIQYNLTDEFNVVEQKLDLEVLMDKMKADNKTLRNQYINQEILKKDIRFQKSPHFPTLSLNAGFDNFNTRIKFVDNDASYTNNFDYYANFTLSFNLSNGGNTRIAIQNAKIQEIIGELSISEMELQLSNTLINFYDLYNIRKQLHDVSLANMESAELNMQISEEKFKTGAINSFNYRDVQIAYLSTANNKLEAIYNLIDTRTEILRMIGGIITEY
ncbi:MAG: TolC family protein [Bacteroidales bacterium]|nr:TolC family protein [Bacteroidales bacterium]